VTCGHELTSQLNSIRRATTTVLNARLIPLLRELIVTVRHTLDDVGITAPLMIVKGDGSLMRAEWAIQRPIETILSGPAASVVGAWHLADEKTSGSLMSAAPRPILPNWKADGRV
jgi:N-methylhydantoinase A/oxoprolinase/acetone carboxylase beta subunit